MFVLYGGVGCDVMKKIILFIVSCVFSFFVLVPSLSVSAAISPPSQNYRNLFYDKAWPPINNLDDYEYFLIFVYPDSGSYRLLVSHSYFCFDESDSVWEYQGVSYDYHCDLNGNTNGVLRYDSSDGLTYNSSSSSLSFSSSSLINGSVIYYSNFEVCFLRKDGSWEDFAFYQSQGKFLEYYDYYNFTNYSGLNDVEISESSESSSGTSWNFGDLFGGIGGILSSGFRAISDFFSNFWNGLSGALTALFIPSESGMQRIKTQLENKFDFVSSFTTAFAVFNNTEGQSLNYQFTWLDGKQYAIDFSWYAPYRLTIRSLSGSLFYFLGFWKCFKMISSVVRINVDGGDGN